MLLHLPFQGDCLFLFEYTTLFRYIQEDSPPFSPSYRLRQKTFRLFRDDKDKGYIE